MDNLVMATPEQSVTERAEGPAQPSTNSEPELKLTFEVKNLSVWYGEKRAIDDVTFNIASNAVTALIGPSGCGKSTFLRTLNRMHELSDNGWITGRVLLDGADIYAPRVNAMQLRRRIGMVFQRPTPFPTMSIYDNVAAGLRVHGRLPRRELDGIVERSLRQAALWGEVKDRLGASAMALSGGQQQRL